MARSPVQGGRRGGRAVQLPRTDLGSLTRKGNAGRGVHSTGEPPTSLAWTKPDPLIYLFILNSLPYLPPCADTRLPSDRPLGAKTLLESHHFKQAKTLIICWICSPWRLTKCSVLQTCWYGDLKDTRDGWGREGGPLAWGSPWSACRPAPAVHGAGAPSPAVCCELRPF